ncbi:hypothetical protein AC579_10617 [Pseudocercospora musae]|uniref:Uncharacterized protein n=1 Tax=Pseudocercospora musae TaxID=113226 RepID=A0A139IKW0_9PEZI|nr:hypothetical protein AC579_10617 [Pseudocercospora musae]
MSNLRVAPPQDLTLLFIVLAWTDFQPLYGHCDILHTLFCQDPLLPLCLAYYFGTASTGRASAQRASTTSEHFSVKVDLAIRRTQDISFARTYEIHVGEFSAFSPMCSGAVQAGNETASTSFLPTSSSSSSTEQLPTALPRDQPPQAPLQAKDRALKRHAAYKRREPPAGPYIPTQGRAYKRRAVVKRREPPRKPVMPSSPSLPVPAKLTPFRPSRPAALLGQL